MQEISRVVDLGLDASGFQPRESSCDPARDGYLDLGGEGSRADGSQSRLWAI